LNISGQSVPHLAQRISTSGSIRGLMSSMHSWGLYNGRYGFSNMVLIDKIPAHDRPLAEQILAGEIDRQKKLKAEISGNGEAAAWIEERHLFQNYKQL
jgi:hypothetical protein